MILAEVNALRSAFSLLTVLAQTFSALGLGFVCVRYGFIDPQRGDMQAVQFFIGRIALPLLVFKIVATSDVGHVDVGVILSCTLGKVCAYILTFCMTWFAYRSKDTVGRRMLTSAVFAFFVTASNDLAIGFPVIQSIYGSEMTVYVAANVLVFQTVLQPLAMVLFEFGGILDGEPSSPGLVSEADPKDRWSALLRKTAKGILLNPIMVATMLGAVYAWQLSWTLVRQESGQYALPEPFGGIIALWTSPFTMMFLFLNGTALRSAGIGVWPAMLVLMKVMVCSYISYGFSQVLVNSENPKAQVLKDFTFFYGTIPAGGAPLIYAQIFNCGTEVLASASILCLILAGPVEFMTALFLGTVTGPVDYEDVWNVMIGASKASAFCAGIFVIFVASGWWGGSFSSRAISVYGVVILLYELWTLCVMRNKVVACTGADSTRDLFVYQFLQNAGYILVIYIEYHLGTRWREGRRARSHVVTLAVVIVAAVATVLVPVPNTYHEMCGVKLDLGTFQSVVLIVWNVMLFVLLVAAGVHGRFIKQRAKGVLPVRKKKAVTPGGWRLPLLSGLVPVEGTPNMPCRTLTPGQDGDLDLTMQQESLGLGGDGVAVATCLIILQVVRGLMGVINCTVQALCNDPVKNERGFTPMIILQDILEHGQGVALLLMVVFQPSVLAKTRDLILGLGACGCCGTLSPSLAVMSEVDLATPYIMGQEPSYEEAQYPESGSLR